LSKKKTTALLRSHVLVGLTYLRPDGEISRRLQFHGTIESVRKDVIEVRRADTGDLFTLPPAPEAFDAAPPGEYRIRSTGEVVVDPDFTCTMTVHLRDRAKES
jgi:hypothetical protein